jgi:zinc transporter 9
MDESSSRIITQDMKLNHCGGDRLRGIPTLPAAFKDKREDFNQPWSVRDALSTLYSASDNLDEDMRNSDKGDATEPPEKRRELRIRAALSVFQALAKEAEAAMASSSSTNQPRGTFSSTQSRHFTSKATPPTGEAEETPLSKTEPDFAEYLTGKMVDGETPPGDTDVTTVKAVKSYPDKPLDPEPLPEFQLPDSPPHPESDDTTETYRHIRKRQKSNVEAARTKTIANVRRALTGNVIICVAKLGAWMSSGSSSMLSEFIHSVVDCGNQSLLLVGLRDAGNVADRKHPYGYGKSVYFWALVSALGTFFLGAGVSMTHAVGELMEPSLQEITWHVWGVLGLSLAIDGYVFGKTIYEVAETKPDNKTLWKHIWGLRDPATLAIILEDGAACLGIVIAFAGISATHFSGMPVFDGMAGVGISALLATMGVALVSVNHRFLLGQAVDRDITEGIEKILRSQRSIDNVQSVQSQWTSPATFSYKAEVDFDGTFLAARLLPRYQQEFLEVRDSLDQELRVLLSWYAEDVIRTVEREVRHIEAEIRKQYPGAEYIELEPMSKDADRFAIDDGMEAQLRRIELEALNRYLKSLYQKSSTGGDAKDASKTSSASNTQVGDDEKDTK